MQMKLKHYVLMYPVKAAEKAFVVSLPYLSFLFTEVKYTQSN